MIHVLSQDAFDDKMVELGLDDSNVENYPNSLFVSIIGTKGSLDEYLHEEDTKHYFQANHTNVINLDFDDVDEDTEYNGVNFKAMSTSQSDKLAKFLDDNISHDNDMEIYIHCRAGISRSRAVAEYIARHYQVSYDEDERKSFYSHLNHGVLRKLERSYRISIT